MWGGRKMMRCDRVNNFQSGQQMSEPEIAPHRVTEVLSHLPRHRRVFSGWGAASQRTLVSVTSLSDAKPRVKFLDPRVAPRAYHVSLIAFALTLSILLSNLISFFFFVQVFFVQVFSLQLCKPTYSLSEHTPPTLRT